MVEIGFGRVRTTVPDGLLACLTKSFGVVLCVWRREDTREAGVPEPAQVSRVDAS